MPTNTYTPLANITLGSSAASVTFSSISQAYRDLVLICNGALVSDGTFLVRLNSDSGTNYTEVYMLGNGSSASSGTSTSLTGLDLTYSSGSTGVMTMNIMDYSATDKHKTTIGRWNNGTYAGASANRWANTAAVTSLTLLGNLGGTIAAGSSFALYGVAA